VLYVPLYNVFRIRDLEQEIVVITNNEKWTVKSISLEIPTIMYSKTPVESYLEIRHSSILYVGDNDDLKDTSDNSDVDMNENGDGNDISPVNDDFDDGVSTKNYLSKYQLDKINVIQVCIYFVHFFF